jgi:hypothetical protein
MELNIAEKFLLLAHHPTKSRFLISGIMINYGLIGALLLELSTEGKISVRNKELVLKTRHDSDPVFSEIISTIGRASKPRKMKFWISRLSRKSNRFKKELMQNLERKRMIRINNKKFLGLFPYKLYYLTETKTRDKMISELKKVVFQPKELTAEEGALLGLTVACKMYRVITTDPTELRTIKKKLRVLIKDMPLAEAVDETIKVVQAAIVAGIAASTAAVAAQ